MSMPSSTLHQLCHAPSLWANCIGQIGDLWQPEDALILLGPAAYGIFDQRLRLFNPVYILQADLQVLGIRPQQIQGKILDYEQWAELVLRHTRHISWK